MAYDDYRGNRDRDDRWRERERGSHGQDRAYGSGRDYGRGDDHRASRGSWGDDDRGFIDRAGDEVRSWFGDDDARQRRERDERSWEQERGMTGQRDNNWGRAGRHDEDRDRSRGYAPDTRSSGGGYSGGGNVGGGYADMGGREHRGPADTFGGSGFGGSEFGGRRFDRTDVGSTGTHGAHPMSAPYGAAGGYSGGQGSDMGSSARSAAIYANARGQGQHGNQDHDPHYSEWRNRQIHSLDRDYDEYRREHQSKFEQEFGTWRERRQGQRSALSRVSEHMEVVGQDGQHIGTVDKVRGDRIILTKNDEAAGGRHHSIPCSWIDRVEDKVMVSKSADEARRAWQDEENNRALFEREDQGTDGPHVLDRSFSGTYKA